MTTFLFSYRMPENHTPGRPDAAAAWTAWFQDMGASVTDPGNPVFESVCVGDRRWTVMLVNANVSEN